MAAKRLWAVGLVLGLGSLLSCWLTDTVLGQGANPPPLGKRRPNGVVVMPAMPVQGVAGIGPDGIPIAKPGEGSAAAQLSAIKIIERSELRQVINVARDCIKDKDWEQAVTALQALLDNKEDHYVQVRDRDAQGRETLRWTSVKFEANNLLGSMPAEGIEVYEQRYGAKAKGRLEEAKRSGNRELLAEVAQRYCHTRAGVEANELLATLFLARGQSFIAALRFEKVLAMDPERAKTNPLTLYKAALAFHRAGDAKSAEATWQKLETSLQDTGGLRLGEQTIVLARLKEVLAEDGGTTPANPYQWPLVRGNLTNTAQASGSPPLLDSVLWRRPLLLDRKPDQGKDAAATGQDETNAKLRIDQAIKNVREQNLPVMSGFFPIAANGLVIYRTHSGIRAVAIAPKAGKGHAPGEVVWNSVEFYGGLANLLDQSKKTKPIIDNWLGGGPAPNPNQPNPFNPVFPNGMPGAFYFQPGLPGVAGVLFENSTIGTLSTDGQYVYAIDDLAVPPPYGYNVYLPMQANFGEVRPLVGHNVLNAFDLRTGKLIWALGDEDDPAFADSHFLGVPIPVGGKLYVLNEKNPPGNTPGGEAELRLVCIDPSKRQPGPGSRRPVIVEPIQLLGMVQPQNRVTHDLSRRTNATQLAFGGGILVCPTNAGEVFGVDLMTRSLVWSYPYREQPHVGPFQANVGGPFIGIAPGIRNPNLPLLGGSTLSNWKSAPPAIAEGKVVFTAPDASSVHCINLRDGTPVWKSRQQEGDLFLAGVFSGKVLVVSKTGIRALHLHTGQTLWSVPTGDVPSGQGVCSKDIYYQPLSKGEILAVDVVRGTLKAHNRAAGAAAQTPPGNLVFAEGCVLSLTPTDLVAYPQLAARLAEATERLKADPADLTNLTDHGELLLKDGQVQAAVNDLEKVVARKAPGALGQRARDRLYEALTDLLQVNFKGTSDRYLDLYRELCSATDNEQERQLRKAKFFRVVGEGREAQGNLVAAFAMYKDYGALPIHNQTGGVAAGDDPGHKVPTSVWLRGRVSAMIAHATAEQRAPLEAKIRAEWEQVLAKKDLDAIRSFVGMFDVPFAVGREARLHLADAIVERNDRPAFLEAELSLEQLLGPGLREEAAVGGKALAELARLEEKKGTADAMKLAAAYYRELARYFGRAEVRNGKTGADLFNDLAADKRFLPYLEEGGNPWGQAKIAARKLPTPGAPGLLQFVLRPVGDDSPFARQHRLAFDITNAYNTTLRLIDAATGKERWSTPLGQVANAGVSIFNSLYQSNVNLPYHPNAAFRSFHVKGHLLVCQVGAMAYAVDGDNGKVLWRFPLVEGLDNQQVLNIQPAGADPDGNPEFIVFNPQFGRPQNRLSLGQVVAVEASYVALLTSKGLTVNDPLRGTLLWRKTDVSPGTRVFGDAEYLFLVEGGDGAGRVLRAIDGAPLDKVPDFGAVYSRRVALDGRRILATAAGKDGTALRLYDIVQGKDVWSKTMPAGAAVLRSEAPGLTGFVDGKGNLTVLDLASGAEVLRSNVAQGRIGPDDAQGLHEPLLLADAERFYVALNKPLAAGKVAGGNVHTNFSNGLRCQPVNGFVAAVYRQDGTHQAHGKDQPHKKGAFAWHSLTPLLHQMVVLEQVEQLPVLLFSARYGEMMGNGGFRWQSYTQSLDKRTGKFLYDHGPENTNSLPQFAALRIDPQAGIISLAGAMGVIQHYIDDGRKLPQTGVLQGGGATGWSSPLNLPGLPQGPGGVPPFGGALVPGGVVGGGVIVQPLAPGQLGLPRVRIIRNVEAMPALPAPPPAPVPVPAQK